VSCARWVGDESVKVRAAAPSWHLAGQLGVRDESLRVERASCGRSLQSDSLGCEGPIMASAPQMGMSERVTGPRFPGLWGLGWAIAAVGD
jgi:hypothetical protein